MTVVELTVPSCPPPPFLFTCKWRNTGLVVLRDEIQVIGKVPVGSKKIAFQCFRAVEQQWLKMFYTLVRYRTRYTYYTFVSYSNPCAHIASAGGRVPVQGELKSLSPPCSAVYITMNKSLFW